MSETRVEFGTCQEWIDSDPDLHLLLNTIAARESDTLAQASAILEQVGRKYLIPLMPQDINEDHYQVAEETEPQSVYENLAILRYFFPDQPLPSLAMQALYNVRNHRTIPLEAVLQHYSGGRATPNNIMIFFIGDLPEPALSFNIPVRGNDWTKR